MGRMRDDTENINYYKKYGDNRGTVARPLGLGKR